MKGSKLQASSTAGTVKPVDNGGCRSNVPVHGTGGSSEFGLHGPMATPEDGSSVAPITGVQIHVIIFVGLIHYLKILLSALFLPCTKESERWRGGTIAAHLSEKSAKGFFIVVGALLAKSVMDFLFENN
ncbi:unnamed protein product [Linum tenue]|uniref:Uncharacterized protein n=1 Tax=Linum tenue TaxID=586396 RepID=A0AAV0KTI6_9ROSI|nr:unnamed protein product [Linum tenue]